MDKPLKALSEEELEGDNKEEEEIEEGFGEEEQERLRHYYKEFHSSMRSIEIVGQMIRNRFGSFERTQLQNLAEEGNNVGLRVLNEHLKLTSDNKANIIEIIRQIMEEDKSLSNEEIAVKAKTIFILSCYWITFGLIEVIANAMSLYELLPVFRDIFGKHKGSVAYGLIYIAIEMQSSKRLPKREIGELYEKMESDVLGRRMLRQVVLRHLYLHPVDYRDKQWLSQTIDIPLRRQLLAARVTTEKNEASDTENRPEQ